MHFSAVKSNHLKKLGGQGAGIKVKLKRGPKPKVAVQDYVAPPAKVASSGDGDLLAALEGMKPLVAALAVKKVKRLADLLA